MGVHAYRQKGKSKTFSFYKFMFDSQIYQAWGFPTKTHAERAETKKRTDLLEKRHAIQVKDVTDPTFKDFAAKYLERLTIRSMHRYRASARILIAFFNRKRLSQITPDLIDRYKHERLYEVTPATVNRDLYTLSNMFEKAITWGDAMANPVKQIEKLEEPPGRIRYLQVEELNDARWQLESLARNLKSLKCSCG